MSASWPTIKEESWNLSSGVTCMAHFTAGLHFYTLDVIRVYHPLFLQVYSSEDF